MNYQTNFTRTFLSHVLRQRLEKQWTLDSTPAWMYTVLPLQNWIINGHVPIVKVFSFFVYFSHFLFRTLVWKYYTCMLVDFLYIPFVLLCTTKSVYWLTLAWTAFLVGPMIWSFSGCLWYLTVTPPTLKVPEWRWPDSVNNESLSTVTPGNNVVVVLEIRAH